MWVLNDTFVGLALLGPNPVRTSSSALVKSFPQIPLSGTIEVRLWAYTRPPFSLMCLSTVCWICTSSSHHWVGLMTETAQVELTSGRVEAHGPLLHLKRPALCVLSPLLSTEP